MRRPDLKVRTRSGFLGITDSDFEPAEVEGAQMQLAASLDSPFQQVGVGTTVRCAFINVEKTRSIILTRVGIGARDLTLEGPPQNRSAILHLMVRAYGVDGAELEGGMDKRLKISLDQDGYRVALANGLVYSTNVTVSKPGPYQVRAAVLDEASGRIGTSSEFLIVPKLGGQPYHAVGHHLPVLFRAGEPCHACLGTPRGRPGPIGALRVSGLQCLRPEPRPPIPSLPGRTTYI